MNPQNRLIFGMRQMTITKIEIGMRGCTKCGNAYPDPYCPEIKSTTCAACTPIGHPSTETKRILRPFLQHRNMTWKALVMQMRRYKLTFDEITEIVSKQGNNCGKCGKVIIGAFCIDHDHECCSNVPTCGLCTRGLICYSCNVLLAGYDHYIENREEVDMYVANYRKQRENKISRSGSIW